ncbi:MIOREX complex component 10 [Pseudozyma hubeiensis]|nr:MIOREX complex component 10 [Pseudozyma hubeiensis]
MLRSASRVIRTAAESQPQLSVRAFAAASQTLSVSHTALRQRNDDSSSGSRTKYGAANPSVTAQSSRSSSAPASGRAASSSSTSSPSPPAASSTATSKPVQISYNPPKGTTGGGSITLNLPPQLVQAMSRKKNVNPSKTSSARAKAQASKALRQTLPEPTTGEVYAWATAHSYSFSELVRSGRLPANFQVFEDNEVIHVPQWPVSAASSAAATEGVAAAGGSASRGEVFIFRSGSYVTWGMDEEQSQRFLRSVIQGRDLKFQVEVGRYSQIGDEAMDYLYASSQPTRVQGDIIVIGQPPKSFDAEAETTSEESSSDDRLEDNMDGHSSTAATSNSADSVSSTTSSNPSDPYTSFGTEWTPTLARLAFSQGLARSARLTVQESALSRFLTTVSAIPAQLETAGSVPLSRTATIKHTGTLLRLRQTANLDRDNFYDEPEVYWENAKMEDHYRSICHNLDVGQRFETLNEKLDHCENLLGVVRALLTEKSTHRMELIIIGLIAFEAGLALLGHGWVPTPENVRGWWGGVREYFGMEDGVKEGFEEGEVVIPSKPSTQPHLV